MQETRAAFERIPIGQYASQSFAPTAPSAPSRNPQCCVPGVKSNTVELKHSTATQIPHQKNSNCSFGRLSISCRKSRKHNIHCSLYHQPIGFHSRKPISISTSYKERLTIFQSRRSTDQRAGALEVFHRREKEKISRDCRVCYWPGDAMSCALLWERHLRTMLTGLKIADWAEKL